MHALLSNLPTDTAQLQLVLDALPVLISFVNADERYALVNKAYEEWFGVPRDAVVGRTLREILGAEAYEKLRPSVVRCVAGERFDVEEFDVPYRLGGTRDIRVSFVPRSNERGESSGYVALVTDITAARRHAAERERLYVAEKDARREAERVRGLVEVERDSAKMDAKLEVRSRRVSEDARERAEFLLTVASTLAVSLDAEVMMQRFVDAIAPARASLATVWMPNVDGALRLRAQAPAGLTEVEAAVAGASGMRVAVERVMTTATRFRSRTSKRGRRRSAPQRNGSVQTRSAWRRCWSSRFATPRAWLRRWPLRAVTV